MNLKKFSDKQLKAVRKFLMGFNCEGLECKDCIFHDTVMGCAIYPIDREYTARKGEK